VLKRGGLDDDHIVVMHADDIALDIQNPHRFAAVLPVRLTSAVPNFVLEPPKVQGSAC